MALMRLQKFLSTAGICSRRRGEAFIKAGRVSVNGQIVVELGTKIDPAKDQVSFDGRPIKNEQRLVYIVLNKPLDYVTSCRHPGEKIVLELVDIAQRGRSLGVLLVGAQQTASRVAQEVMENASLRASTPASRSRLASANSPDRGCRCRRSCPSGAGQRRC